APARGGEQGRPPLQATGSRGAGCPRGWQRVQLTTRSTTSMSATGSRLGRARPWIAPVDLSAPAAPNTLPAGTAIRLSAHAHFIDPIDATRDRGRHLPPDGGLSVPPFVVETHGKPLPRCWT